MSLISTTVAATVRRRPQLQMLRRIGAHRRQVTRVMTIEAVLVAGAGIVLGTLVALTTLVPFDSALERVSEVGRVAAWRRGVSLTCYRRGLR